MLPPSDYAQTDRALFRAVPSDKPMLTDPATDLGRRRPVWEALSTFFLDTELNEQQMRELACILNRSGYDAAQLEAILTREIGPLLYRNLYSMTGIWSGFDVAWIEREILAGRHRTIDRWYNTLNRWACARVLRRIKADEWSRMQALMLQESKTPRHEHK